MSLVRRSRRHRVEERATWPIPSWLTAGGWVPPAAGEAVTLENSMRANAFAACRRVLVSEVAQLPVHTFRKRGGAREMVPDPQVVASPSGGLTRRAWVAQVMDSLVRAGNAYLHVSEVDGAGAPVMLESVSPSIVSWQPVDGVLRPHVNGVERGLWPLGNLVHIPASAFIQAGSPVAVSPVEASAESMSLGLAAEKYTAQWFGSGGHPSSVLYVDREIEASAAEAIKDRYVEAATGRRPAVFGSGIKREAIQEAPDESMLNLMRFVVEQACRTTGVPPAMVYGGISGQAVTYANVSDSDLQFLKHSLGVWLGDLEDHWSRWLPVRGQFVRFNSDALLRSTPKERHEIYASRLASKTVTVNEIRRLEDEEPFADPEFDQPGIPGGAPVSALTGDLTNAAT